MESVELEEGGRVMTRMSLTGHLSVALTGFLQPFVASLAEVHRRAVGELVFLIVGAGSIMVSQMARRMSWGSRRMIQREKRLCRHAKTRSFDDVDLSGALRREAARHLRPDSLVLLDTSDLSKPYARKMEHVGIVHDASRKTAGPGYWLVSAFLRLKRGRIVPMLMRCFSLVEPGIKSFNAVLIQAMSQLKEVLTEGRGILVADRGFDAIRLLEPLLKYSLRFLVRMVGSRDLLFEENGTWRKQNVREWVDVQLAAGWRMLVATVRLPQREEDLQLVVAPPQAGRHREPMMLLTRGVLSRRHDARWIVQAYRNRWAIEDGLRAFKQSFGVEQVRVMTLRAIQRLVLLAAVAMAFVIHLTHHAKAHTKRLIEAAAMHFDQIILYDFCRFAAGLRNLLTAAHLQAHLGISGDG
jgi:hypothetical protein